MTTSFMRIITLTPWSYWLPITLMTQCPAPCPAQVAVRPTGADELRALKGTYRPPDEFELRRERDVLIQELRDFETNPKSPRNVFDLVALRELIDRGLKTDLKRLTELERTFYRDLEGLERPEVLRFRKALGRYRDVLTYGLRQNAIAAYDRTIDEAISWLATHESNPTAESAFQLGQRLGWLERSGHGIAAVAAIQSRFSQPNFHVTIHKQFLEGYFRKDIDVRSPVTEVIRSADVTGDATTKGKTHLELVPNEDGALVRVVMVGTMTSDVVATKAATLPLGRRIDVRIPSRGTTEVRVEKTFRLTDEGVSPLPATAECRTSTSYLAVESTAKTKFIQRQVANRAYAEKPLGEAESAVKAACQLRRRADEIVLPAEASQVLNGYRTIYLDHQIRDGSAPVSSRWHTTADAMSYTILRRTTATLGAWSPPFPLPEVHHFVVAQHQSDANNQLGPFLGGRWMTDDQLSDMYKIIFGHTPKPLRLGSHMARWSLRLDSDRPFQFEFADNTISLTLFFTERKFDNRSVAAAMSVGATYRSSISEDGVTLRRVGDIRVASSTKDGATDREGTEFLTSKFGDLFSPTLAADGLVAPDGGNFDALRAISITDVRTANGWLLIGLDDKTKSVNVPFPSLGKR